MKIALILIFLNLAQISWAQWAGPLIRKEQIEDAYVRVDGDNVYGNIYAATSWIQFNAVYGKIFGQVDDATIANTTGTFTSNKMDLVLEELASDIAAGEDAYVNVTGDTVYGNIYAATSWIQFDKVYGSAYANIDNSTYTNSLGTFTDTNLGLILEEMASDIAVLSASDPVVVAIAGELSINTYHLEIQLESGKRVVGEWPVVWVGGIVYPEEAVLESAPQLQHRAIHLYLYGDETPWPAGTAWKAIYSLESVSVVVVAAGTGGDMVLPIDIPGVDYLTGNLLTME